MCVAIKQKCVDFYYCMSIEECFQYNRSLISNGRPRSGSPICLSPSMITDRFEQHEVLLLINHKNYNFREKKNTKV